MSRSPRADIWAALRAADGAALEALAEAAADHDHVLVEGDAPVARHVRAVEFRPQLLLRRRLLAQLFVRGAQRFDERLLPDEPHLPHVGGAEVLQAHVEEGVLVVQHRLQDELADADAEDLVLDRRRLLQFVEVQRVRVPGVLARVYDRLGGDVAGERRLGEGAAAHAAEGTVEAAAPSAQRSAELQVGGHRAGVQVRPEIDVAIPRGDALEQ
mmetsp:Transcript_41424/g.128023  ORF Transcript_41424/g.128023 Transcript_41424/m.128023 type:complete len:213 (-) Transcript_41424:777-1415(-)